MLGKSTGEVPVLQIDLDTCPGSEDQDHHVNYHGANEQSHSKNTLASVFTTMIFQYPLSDIVGLLRLVGLLHNVRGAFLAFRSSDLHVKASIGKRRQPILCLEPLTLRADTVTLHVTVEA